MDEGSENETHEVHVEGSLKEIDKRLRVLEAERSKATPRDVNPVGGRLDERMDHVVRIVEGIALSERVERTARRWVGIPGIIGVSVVVIGLALLLYGLVGATDARFITTVSGGVVLVAVGALSASATALAAAKSSVVPKSLGRPYMQRMDSDKDSGT